MGRGSYIQVEDQSFDFLGSTRSFILKNDQNSGRRDQSPYKIDHLKVVISKERGPNLVTQEYPLSVHLAVISDTFHKEGVLWVTDYDDSLALGHHLGIVLAVAVRAGPQLDLGFITTGEAEHVTERVHNQHVGASVEVDDLSGPPDVDDVLLFLQDDWMVEIGPLVDVILSLEGDQQKHGKSLDGVSLYPTV